MRLGLNIGSGKNYIPSTPEMQWINCDGHEDIRADERMPLYQLDHKYMGQADEIIANDILEHMPYDSVSNGDMWLHILKRWVACLKPGGTIRVQVPDPHQIFKLYEDGTLNEDQMNRVVYGENTSWHDRHFQMFSLLRLAVIMRGLGLEIVREYNLHICAIVIGRKP